MRRPQGGGLHAGGPTGKVVRGEPRRAQPQSAARRACSRDWRRCPQQALTPEARLLHSPQCTPSPPAGPWKRLLTPAPQCSTTARPLCSGSTQDPDPSCPSPALGPYTFYSGLSPAIICFGDEENGGQRRGVICPRSSGPCASQSGDHSHPCIGHPAHRQALGSQKTPHTDEQTGAHGHAGDTASGAGWPEAVRKLSAVLLHTVFSPFFQSASLQRGGSPEADPGNPFQACACCQSPLETVKGKPLSSQGPSPVGGLRRLLCEPGHP